MSCYEVKPLPQLDFHQLHAAVFGFASFGGVIGQGFAACRQVASKAFFIPAAGGTVVSMGRGFFSAAVSG